MYKKVIYTLLTVAQRECMKKYHMIVWLDRNTESSFQPWGYMDSRVWQRYINILKDMGVIEEDVHIDVSKIYTNELLGQ